MLITYRGRQYDTDRRVQCNQLAQELGITVRVAGLWQRGAPPYEVDRALWSAILAKAPGSLTGHELAGGVR